MFIPVVRHGSLSGRRGRLSSKTKLARSVDQPSPPLPLLALMGKAVEDHTNMSVTRQFVSEFRIKYCQLEVIISVFQSAPFNEDIALRIFHCELHATRKLLMAMPQINEISDHDFRILLSRSFFSIMAIRCANRFTTNTDTIMFESGELFSLSAFPACFQQLLRFIISKAQSFSSLIDWEPQAFAGLIALQFLSGNTGNSLERFRDIHKFTFRAKCVGTDKQGYCRSNPEHHHQCSQRSLQWISEQIGEDCQTGK